MGKQSYTIVAKALTNFDSEATVVLVRGTTGSSFNQFLRNNLELELTVLAIALIADVFLAILLGRAIAKPLKQLQKLPKNLLLAIWKRESRCGRKMK
ncbi:hypothetical protein LYNGBM3L_22660 [Moorena producens 3L]|uniref:Uncharacterized protein n=1 Tax=Moorena producens 3L TaxID=489825 RepID=F4XNN8_9CYAN|nr:hypothetical protein [Moorena producens]EGJ33801.1 hypothetical protein LYNGBM3L_22660 [Moorena producens 3L]OLT68970.1 hypothetical protein BI334_31690 [Moorena producens 3L]